MICTKCGTELKDDALCCPGCGTMTGLYVPQKKTISPGVKALLVLASVLLCIALCVSLVATALILDLRLLTGKNNLEKVISHLLFSPAETHQLMPSPAALGGIRRSSTSAQTEENLVGFVYDALKEQYGDQMTVTEDQIQSFLDQSTTKDYLTEKISSYVDDFVNGTQNTTITTEEIEMLIEENKELIESEFGITVTPEIQEQVIDFVEETDINTVIRTEVIGSLENVTISESSSAVAGVTSYTVRHLMEDLRVFGSQKTLLIALLVTVALIAALYFTNRRQLFPTLTCVGIPTLISGCFLSLPLLVLQMLPDVLNEAIGNDMVGGTLGILLSSIAPVHYGMFFLGLALIIIGSMEKKFTKGKKS